MFYIKICPCLGIFSRHNLIKIYTKTHQTAPHFQNFLRAASICHLTPQHMRATMINMYFYMNLYIFYIKKGNFRFF